jgi:hypothetical protein
MRVERSRGLRRVIVLAGVLVASVATHAAAASDDPRIARIRAWFSATEKALPGNRVVRRDLADFAAQGAVLTAWFAGETLAKVNGTSYVEGGRTTDDFYVRGDSIYYVSHTVGKYFLSPDGQLIHRVQYRMYFDHDTLIRWVDTTGKNLALLSAAADSAAKRNLMVARILIDCAKIEGAVQACIAAPKDSAATELAK